MARLLRIEYEGGRFNLSDEENNRHDHNQIGEIFDDLSGSGVAKIYKRISNAINNKKATRKMVRIIEVNVSRLKG